MQRNQHQQYFDATEEFGFDQHFAVAMGISDYIGPMEQRTSIEDPSIGHLKFYIKSWGKNAPSGPDSMFIELETRNCETKDFNDVMGSNRESIFYPTNKFMTEDLYKYGLRMKCLKNPRDLALWGNYDLSHSSNLMTVFEKCKQAESKVKCKNEAEID